MSSDHRTIFQPGKIYTNPNKLNSGFTENLEIPPFSELMYREVKYSPYDGCYAYYFVEQNKKEEIEVWIHENTSIEEINKILELTK